MGILRAVSHTYSTLALRTHTHTLTHTHTHTHTHLHTHSLRIQRSHHANIHPLGMKRGGGRCRNH